MKTGSHSISRLAAAMALALAAAPAHAVLERVGPTSTDPAIGGFPAWYQDTTGLALEFCSPTNASEVNGGWCLLLPGDVPVIPEVFPTRFFDEHFYFAASAAITPATGGKALLTLAQEGAFAVGPPIAGDQITFARIRFVLNPVPASGSYRFIHPYGEDVIDAAAGDKIFFTEDIGIGAPGDFTGALNSRLGPFLLPSAVPGGAEMPALTAANPTPDTDPAHFGGVFAATPYPGNGKSYIADPARIGPVTGSTLPNFVDSTGASRNHNIFRIEGPAGSNLGGPGIDAIETTDFGLMGRVFTSPLPGRVNVQRASYTSNASGQKLDVFATAFATVQGRLPSQPTPAAIAPQLTFFDAPCAGVLDPVTLAVNPPYSAPAGAVETQMFSSAAGLAWGQVRPATIPLAICVKDGTVRDANGNVVPSFFPQRVTDEVTISQADYDPAAGTLTVAATSSDATFSPTLTLAYGAARNDLVNGRITVPGIIAPPASIRVLSSAFGENTYPVSTGFAAGAPAPVGIPVAANDSFTFLEDAGAQILGILANDTNVAGGTVTITGAPRLGTAVVNADGTVTYTSNLNASGADSFTYTVTVGTQISNGATVSLNVTPVNDAPTAVNDSASAVLNLPVQVAVTSNDTDPDGAADIVAAVIVTPPAAGATVTVSGKVVTFTATLPGTYTFTYQAQDAGGLRSNTATVTVTVAAAESLNLTLAQYIVSKSRLRVSGTVTPAAGQTVRIDLVDSLGTVLSTPATAFATDAAGAFNFDSLPVARPNGTTSVKVTTSNGTVRFLTLTLK